MALTNKQLRFVRGTQDLADRLLKVMDEAEDLRALFTAEDYGSIPAEELIPFDLTPAKVVAAMNAYERLVDFRDGVTVVGADFRTVLNQVRAIS